MKYFNNITTPEELKKQFRTLATKLHPDRGGNAEEFKTMMAEYMAISKDFDRAKEQAEAEAEARRQAEEYRKQQEEERKRKEEEARKAAEAMRPVIAEWSAVLEQVPEKGSYCKPSAAYIAAVKRNIKAVFAKHFPGVAVSVTLINKAWGEKAAIKWTDGPTEEEVEAILEFHYFISSEHVCDPYSDYGDDVEIKYNKAWREAFGEISAQRFEFVREFSQLGKAEVIAKIAEILPQFAGVDAQKGTALMSSADCSTLGRFFGFFYDYKGRKYFELSEEERAAASAYECKHMEQQRECARFESKNYDGGATPLRCLVDFFRQYYHISAATTKAAQEAANAPKFTPKHNATYKAVVKALGGNFFAASNDGQGWGERKPITPTEAAELLAKGVRVDLVKPWESYDQSPRMSTVDAGGRKTQEKRAAKFAAVGFTIQITGIYKGVQFVAVSAEVLAELRKDAESVEKQRKAWEAGQQEEKTAHKAESAHTSDAKAEADTNEAPAEGLSLQEIAGGVAVVGDQRTTYRNRKAIKAHGARWNKEAQQWQATTPEAVQRLREWFGVNEPEQTNEQPQAKKEQPQPENKQAEPQSEPKADAKAEGAADAQEVERVAKFAAHFVELVQMLEGISQAAQTAKEQAAEAQARAERKAHKQAEAEQLRADIAQMSAQVAAMSEQLRTMAERLATIEAEADTDSTTADSAGSEPQPETQEAQESPERGDGKPDALDMLRAAAEDVERLTAANAPTAALLARLYVLAAVGLRVRPLIQRAKAIEAAQQRGHLTPDEMADRQRISQETERRAALLLTPEEFRTLYGYDPKTDRKAA